MAGAFSVCPARTSSAGVSPLPRAPKQKRASHSERAVGVIHIHSERGAVLCMRSAEDLAPAHVQSQAPNSGKRALRSASNGGPGEEAFSFIKQQHPPVLIVRDDGDAQHVRGDGGAIVPATKTHRRWVPGALTEGTPVPLWCVGDRGAV